MKKAFWAFLVVVSLVNALTVGCDSQPAAVTDTPPSVEENKTNEEVGATP